MVKELLKVLVALLICSQMQAKHSAKTDDVDRNIYIASYGDFYTQGMSANTSNCMPTRDNQATFTVISGLEEGGAMTWIPWENMPDANSLNNNLNNVTWQAASPNLSNCAADPSFILGDLNPEACFGQQLTYTSNTNTWSMTGQPQRGNCYGTDLIQVTCPSYLDTTSNNCFAFGDTGDMQTKKAQPAKENLISRPGEKVAIAKKELTHK